MFRIHKIFLLFFIISNISFLCFSEMQNLYPPKDQDTFYSESDISNTKNPFALPDSIKEKIITDKNLLNAIISNEDNAKKGRQGGDAMFISGAKETAKNVDVMSKYKSELNTLKLEGCIWQGTKLLAIISGKTFKEGDIVSPGLKLSKILKDKIELKPIEKLPEEKVFTVNILYANKEGKK